MELDNLLEKIFEIGLNDNVVADFKSYQKDLNGTEQDFIAVKLIGCVEMEEAMVCSMRECSKNSTLEYTHEWFTSSYIISGMKGHQLGYVHIYVDYSLIPNVARSKDVTNILKLSNSEMYSDVPTVSMTPCDSMLLRFYVDTVRTLKKVVVIPVCYYLKFSAANVFPLRFEKHTVKVVLDLDDNGAVVAHYTDQACCASKREMFHKQTLLLSRGRTFILKADDKESSMPSWASGDGCVALPMRNVFFYRCRDVLESALCDYGVSPLQQTQVRELQPWKVEYCATAFLATMHLGIGDIEIERIKLKFGEHPKLSRNQLKGEENRSAQLTFLNMYELWLFCNYRDLFEEASVYSKTNSITFHDEISYGVCRICKQGDTPEAIMVCEEPDCIEYAHCFCISSAKTDVGEEMWWCDKHSVAKKRSHDELIA
jgi:hypothetical protein